MFSEKSLNFYIQKVTGHLKLNAFQLKHGIFVEMSAVVKKSYTFRKTV